MNSPPRESSWPLVLLWAVALALTLLLVLRRLDPAPSELGAEIADNLRLAHAPLQIIRDRCRTVADPTLYPACAAVDSIEGVLGVMPPVFR